MSDYDYKYINKLYEDMRNIHDSYLNHEGIKRVRNTYRNHYRRESHSVLERKLYIHDTHIFTLYSGYEINNKVELHRPDAIIALKNTICSLKEIPRVSMDKEGNERENKLIKWIKDRE